MAQSPILAAIQQICQEKNISLESVIETIEAALAAAYRKDFGQKNQNIVVEYDPQDGSSRVFDVKTVVTDELKAEAEAEAAEREAAIARGEDPDAEAAAAAEAQAAAAPAVVGEDDDEAEEEEELKYNPKLHISLSDAKEIKDDAQLDEEIRVELQVPEEYGRMAAQTAKQVIIQRLREAERGSIYEEFKDFEGTVMMGTVHRREGPNVLIDLHRTIGLLPREEQVDRERYRVGDRIKVYVKSVEMGGRGPQIILSRRSTEVVRELFSIEIPEIANGSIDIKAIAREAGERSKVAVWTDDDAIDPIGSCVGQRGSRVQTIIGELSGEKIDIIEWSEDMPEFVGNALLPAKIVSVEIDEEEKKAIATVESEQLSLAIGKLGQNVRLAAKLTGYTISIIELTDDNKEREVTAEELETGVEEQVEAAVEPAAEAATATTAATDSADETAPAEPAASEETPVVDAPADEAAGNEEGEEEKQSAE